MADDGTSAAETGASSRGIVLYPIDPYLIIIAVLFIVGCFQWGAFFFANFNSQKRSIRDEESIRSSARGTFVFRLSLALVNFYRVLAFRIRVGFRSYVFNLTEIFFMVAYLALLFAWTFITKPKPDGKPLNWCSRAGLLAASQFPLITVLGTKNNIISVITRIGSNKLNFVHRLAARSCLILVGIHILGGDDNFSFYERASSESEIFGIIAASVFGSLVVISLRPVRERAYELFSHFHFVAVIALMIAVIVHVDSYSETTFRYYIWPSFIIWTADRSIRTARLIYFNLAYFVSSQRHATLDATTVLLSNSVVRVRFRRPNDFHWLPGQFAYLIIPRVSRLPFEAHPFSIASIDSTLFAPDTESTGGSCGKELDFFIGVKKGFSKRLQQVAARGERVKVYIDGPYGEGVNLDCYHTSLLIAGGTGITFAMPALLSIVESVRNESSCCRRVVLIWSIRDADFLNWVSESLSKAVRFAPPGLVVDIQVFLTKSHPSSSSTTLVHRNKFEPAYSNPFEDQNPFEDPQNPSDKLEKAILAPSWLKVSSGRPKLDHILDEEINAASGRVCVSVCGPSAMTSAVREALRLPWSSPSSPLNGGPSVTLHVESFAYA